MTFFLSLLEQCQQVAVVVDVEAVVFRAARYVVAIGGQADKVLLVDVAGKGSGTM